MSKIYEILRPKKGYAYTDEQIVDYTLIGIPIPANKKNKGNSRIYGDIEEANFKNIVDIIISLCSRYNLDYKETAYTLLICLAESGFNPDAAAGTTSAAGLAQYTKDTANAFRKRAKELIGVDIDMRGNNVFDATIGSYGVLVAFLFNKELAINWGFKPSDEKYWQLIYMLHHDGPGYYNDDRGKQRAYNFKWRKDAIRAYERIFKQKLVVLTALLKQKVETKIKLTDNNGSDVENKNYILATVKNSSNEKPSHLSMDRGNETEINVIFGKTNSKGESKSILSRIGDEIITIILPDNYKDLIHTSSTAGYVVKKGDTLEKIAKSNATTVNRIIEDNNIQDKNKIKVGQILFLGVSESYSVKSGDTLAGIAKKFGTTIEEIAKDNKISNINNIAVGKKLKINKYLRHKPSNSALNQIFNNIGLGNLNLDILEFSKNHTAKPTGSISNSAQQFNNMIELSTPVAKEAVNNQKVKEPPKIDKNKTQLNGNTKDVKVKISDGMAVIYTFQDMDYGPFEEPKGGYTVFYDHLGNKIFSFKSGSRVSSKAKSNADGAFTGFYTIISGGTRTSQLGAAYGTTKIRSTDTRARWVHGGGSGLKDPYAEKQGWRVTMGCTRAQNKDVEILAEKIINFQRQYPNIKIKYIRDKKGTYPK